MTSKRKLPIGRLIIGGLLTYFGGWAMWSLLSEGHTFTAGFAFAALMGAYAGLLSPSGIND